MGYSIPLISPVSGRWGAFVIVMTEVFISVSPPSFHSTMETSSVDVRLLLGKGDKNNSYALYIGRIGKTQQLFVILL